MSYKFKQLARKLWKSRMTDENTTIYLLGDQLDDIRSWKVARKIDAMHVIRLTTAPVVLGSTALGIKWD